MTSQAYQVQPVLNVVALGYLYQPILILKPTRLTRMVCKAQNVGLVIVMLSHQYLLTHDWIMMIELTIGILFIFTSYVIIKYRQNEKKRFFRSLR
jgi:hypothetical protein